MPEVTPDFIRGQLDCLRWGERMLKMYAPSFASCSQMKAVLDKQEQALQRKLEVAEIYKAGIQK